MRSESIREALRGHYVTRQYFKDVYPYDLLPHLQPGKAYVVNSHSHLEEGEHWMAVYRGYDGTVRFMDSYGQSPPSFLRKYRVTHTGIRYQGVQPTCGLYCLLFVLSVKKPELLNSLDPHDWISNDKWIRKFALREFGVFRL